MQSLPLFPAGFFHFPILCGFPGDPIDHWSWDLLSWLAVARGFHTGRGVWFTVVPVFPAVLFTILIVSCTSWNILYFLYSRQCIFLTFVLNYIYRLMVYVNLTFLYFVIALEVLTCSMLHSNFSGKNTL